MLAGQLRLALAEHAAKNGIGVLPMQRYSLGGTVGARDRRSDQHLDFGSQIGQPQARPEPARMRVIQLLMSCRRLASAFFRMERQSGSRR
ncbi:MAG TPA: hypothetical protein DHV63_05775 [Pseudomonas sp.]|nr:hypothetical protein [Pseudomonas sp.]